MKERIQKIIIALIFLLALSIVLVLMEYFLPSWVNYSLGGLLLAWWLYDVSKPEKKDVHYWLYVIDYDEKISQGVISTTDDKFKLPKSHIDNFHDINHISVVEIDKETFDFIMSKK